MVSTPVGVARDRRAGERGFTLIETLVSIAILGIISACVATLFSAGLSMLRPGGPQDRLLGAHDLMVIEQTISQDGARAACARVPSGSMYPFSCGKVASVCTAGDLCFAWPQVSDSSCHVVDYSIGTTTSATRTEYSFPSPGAGSSISHAYLARAVPVSLTVGAVVTVTPPGQTYTWVRALTLSITATGTTSGPAQSLTLHPIATDPGSASAAITSAGNPC